MILPVGLKNLVQSHKYDKSSLRGAKSRLFRDDRSNFNKFTMPSLAKSRRLACSTCGHIDLLGPSDLRETPLQRSCLDRTLKYDPCGTTLRGGAQSRELSDSA